MRTFLSCLFIALVLLGLPLHAGAADERLIAVIMIKDQPRYQTLHDHFLAQLSPDIQQQCKIYVQSPNADIMSLRNSARKAVAIGADLIVVYGTEAALAAQAESRNTPVLFADVYDPVKQGLVTRKGRAKGQTIGVRGDGPIQTLLKAFLESTHAADISALYNPKSPVGKAQVESLQEMGQRKNFDVSTLEVSRVSDLPSVLQGLPEGVGGLLVTDCSVLTPALNEIISLANKQGVAVISQVPGSADLGVLMSLENDPAEQGTALSQITEKVLSGARVEELSLVKPRNITLNVNLKVAKRLGISVPFEVLASTSRVIR